MLKTSTNIPLRVWVRLIWYRLIGKSALLKIGYTPKGRPGTYRRYVLQVPFLLMGNDRITTYTYADKQEGVNGSIRTFLFERILSAEIVDEHTNPE